MKAIMIRVGVDSGEHSGEWNAPCNPDNRDFLYVPVPAGDRYEDPSLNPYYADTVVPAIEGFSQRNHTQASLPVWIKNDSAHLDPDFRSCRLSYGNSTNNKGKALLELAAGDIVIFYNSMQPINKPEQTGNLEYGIIGRLTVQAIKQVAAITDEAEIQRNIHSRRANRVPTDVVVFGEPDESGRLEKYLPIGKYQRLENHSSSFYWLRDSLVEEWGGVNHRYIQMSLNPIKLSDVPRFLEWWHRQKPSLVHANNPKNI